MSRDQTKDVLNTSITSVNSTQSKFKERASQFKDEMNEMFTHKRNTYLSQNRCASTIECSRKYNRGLYESNVQIDLPLRQSKK